ncbi:MAG: hypothetical protein M0Q43_09425 [Methanothrix sp.]|jgi:hypothetical protein|nr:hypothetical protein [Methanothrix sp.]
MEAQNIIHFLTVTELLQYFTGTDVTFAEADDSLAASGIGSGWSEGDIFLCAASAASANNVEHTIATVAADKLTTTSVITADTPGETIKLNQVVYTDWKDVSCMAKIVGSITSSGNCTVLVQQSQDGVNVDFAASAISVTGGTSKEIDVAVYLRYARLKITNSDADQTTFRAVMNGRTVS